MIFQRSWPFHLQLQNATSSVTILTAIVTTDVEEVPSEFSQNTRTKCAMVSSSYLRAVKLRVSLVAVHAFSTSTVLDDVEKTMYLILCRAVTSTASRVVM